MLPDTVFDVASLTKILAVWSTVGTLWEDGLLPLDEPLGAFWPEVTGHPLGRATARNLLTHTAGLPPPSAKASSTKPSTAARAKPSTTPTAPPSSSATSPNTSPATTSAAPPTTSPPAS